ncbi:MAG: hypothetical protein ACFE95_10685 [Candidatus Hodarchaeota archaeon]
MDNSIKTILISSGPFFTLIISILIIGILTYDYSNPLDTDWTTRQFVLGMFMFAALSIIPRLLHIRLFLLGKTPYITINLSHHSPDLQIAHEFKFRTHSICSGCFGSFLGILLAEAIFLVYFSAPSVIFVRKFAIEYLIIGIFLILISYSRYFIILEPNIRLIQHSSLFSGIAFSIIGCDLLFKSAFSMMLLLPSWLLFLFGRAYLGKLDHKKANSQASVKPLDSP